MWFCAACLARVFGVLVGYWACGVIVCCCMGVVLWICWSLLLLVPCAFGLTVLSATGDKLSNKAVVSGAGLLS